MPLLCRVDLEHKFEVGVYFVARALFGYAHLGACGCGLTSLNWAEHGCD